MHASRSFPTSSAVRRTVAGRLLPALLLCIPFLCQCAVWHAHRDIRDLRQAVRADQAENPGASALYHLQVAEGLLAAAEKQYEDADFQSALDLTRQARTQLDRSRKLRTFQKHLDAEGTGDAP